MTRIARSHPRYASLVVRDRLARAVESGIAVPEGLIAHGRAEAFDYLLGERTTPSARRAEAEAARWLVAAKHPVLSVNGNVAALAAAEVAQLARAVPNLSVEVNLFHRTPRRARSIARVLRAAGVPRVLGLAPTVRIPGLRSDRARVDAEGIAVADVCLIPLEDGDRAEALRRLGKTVISIDLNPLSRTSRAADLPIVDELTRALRSIRRSLPRTSLRRSSRRRRLYPATHALSDALEAMRRGFNRSLRPPARPRGAGRAARRPTRGTTRRSRRTP